MIPRNRADAPVSHNISTALKSFSFTEKGLFALFALICIVSGLLFAWGINTHLLVDVPSRGGTLTEGIVGSPRFINPLLAVSDADEDLTSLVYSGLLKATPEGTLINDLSKEYTISEDGLQYTVTLKDDIYFHDGEPITTKDVEFTIKHAQDSMLKSPKRINWLDITVQKINDKQIAFILKQPYSPFIENLTMGILPEHMWKNLDSDQFAASIFNTEPIGSGPYKVHSVERNSGGLPTFYELTPFKDYALGEPYIKRIILRFYTNEDELIEAYKNGDIDSLNGIPPQEVEQIITKDTRTEQSPLPRVFGVFFNQNQAPVFVNKEVRMALNVAVDKEHVVREVLHDYGTPIDEPLMLPQEDMLATEASSTPIVRGTDAAISILTKGGWVLNSETGIMEKTIKGEKSPLAFSISTGNAPELKQTALILQEQWSKIGADVDIKVFETSDLNQDIIRPRKYDALLFGEIIGRDFDLYPFWHSSQRNDPGLNIAMYANIKADKLLEEMRATTDTAVKKEKYHAFADLISEDVPAVFTYSPDFIYLVPNKIKNLKLGSAVTPSERFMNIYEWYIETNKVWKIFIPNQ